MLETAGCGLVFDAAAANRIDTAMKFHQLMIASALPLAFVACKESEVEKAKADVKATADEAVDKTKAAAADAADKIKEVGADAAEKASEAAKDAEEKLREE